MDVLVTDGLQGWARLRPERPAMIFDGDDVVDYQTLDRWTDNAAHYLAGKGLKQGDRIGIIGSNSLEWCAAALGALKLGAVVTPYNDRFVADELRYLVDSSQATIVLADDQHREQMLTGLEGTGVPLHGLAEFTELRHAEHHPVERPSVNADDPAVLVYTSGTTSNPKGVVFTHRSTLAFITEMSFMEPAYREGNRLIYVLSMSGAPGILWHVIHPLTRGMTVYYEKGFDPQTTLRRLADAKINVIMGVPLLFEQMAAHPEFADADLSSVLFASVAGARSSVSTIQQWLDKGVPLRQGYGMTEAGGLYTVNDADQALNKPESVGRGYVFSGHRVVGPDGKECAVEEPGEVIIRGPAVATGYWNNPEATAAAFRDGWFYSGDVGIIDADGHLRIVDRMKDLIISGGFNIAPSEIESVIVDMPGVEEVCVFSVPDEKFGEGPAAVVYAPGGVTEAEIAARCQEKLARFKQPREIHIVDAPLPRMASGKIARKDIRAQYVDA